MNLPSLPGIPTQFRLLWTERFVQEEALIELLKHDNGTLAAATGFGKTVTAAALIAKRKNNTLIITDREN
jgi:superfamily II DNA or RNA helicase